MRQRALRVKRLREETASDVYVKTEGCSVWIENNVRGLHKCRRRQG